MGSYRWELLRISTLFIYFIDLLLLVTVVLTVHGYIPLIQHNTETSQCHQILIQL